MSGPCLCGDPYCWSCGNPSAARFDEWVESFVDEISEMGLDDWECNLLRRVGIAAVEEYRAQQRQTDIAFDGEGIFDAKQAGGPVKSKRGAT